ncbi:MAG: DUF4058 family protein [Planctomycetes bacterium]|nr:DUF4058 family protein [Planctomycetota bacterium]
MPLRDHFHPPLDDVASWEELHGQWPATIVQQLRKKLPAGYVAGPRVHAGAQVEIDVAAYEKDDMASSLDAGGAAGTAVWAPAAPSVAVETELPDYDEYEVRVYDARRGRRLVAAIEIVSPANKDRPESRNSFIAKCAALLQKGVAVSIVDLVTIRHFNLYADLLAFIGHRDSTLGAEPPPICAASCRWLRKGDRAILETWSHALAVGHPLPTLPLWLTEVRVVPLDLEQSYEQACDDLNIS